MSQDMRATVPPSHPSELPFPFHITEARKYYTNENIPSKYLTLPANNLSLHLTQHTINSQTRTHSTEARKCYTRSQEHSYHLTQQPFPAPHTTHCLFTRSLTPQRPGNAIQEHSYPLTQQAFLSLKPHSIHTLTHSTEATHDN